MAGVSKGEREDQETNSRIGLSLELWKKESSRDLVRQNHYKSKT